VYQVGINKGIILRCTAYQISRCGDSYQQLCSPPKNRCIVLISVWLL